MFADSSSGQASGRFDGINGASVIPVGAVGADPAIMLNGACCSATSITTNPTLPTGHAARTLELWVKLTGTGFAVAASYGPNGGVGTRSEFGIGTSSSELGVITGGDDHYFSYGTGANIDDGAWHYLVVTYDGNVTLTAYLDGTSLGSQTLGGQLATVNQVGFELGYAPSFTPWQGGLDEVAVYSTALTSTTVSAHYSLRGH